MILRDFFAEIATRALHLRGKEELTAQNLSNKSSTNTVIKGIKPKKLFKNTKSPLGASSSEKKNIKALADAENLHLNQAY